MGVGTEIIKTSASEGSVFAIKDLFFITSFKDMSRSLSAIWVLPLFILLTIDSFMSKPKTLNPFKANKTAVGNPYIQDQLHRFFSTLSIAKI